MITEKEPELKSIGCNVEIYGKGLCGCRAVWGHPRYPTGTYCEKHKEAIQSFFKDGWYLLKDIGTNDYK